MGTSRSVAVIIPCYNEEAAIGKVVADFRAALPEASVYVYDNNSRDRTVAVARAAGASIRSESRQGKGNAVRRAFSDVDADVYVLVDGDDTYDPSVAPALVEMLWREHLDYINIAREHTNAAAYRRGHAFGNRLLSGALVRLFGSKIRDILSGYKVLSRRFVKSYPLISAGFELEAELMVHALELVMPIKEVWAPYKERPEGSVSKLSNYKDGFRILSTILKLVETERPLAFFGVIAFLLATICLGLGVPVVFEYLDTGLVERFPTAMAAGFSGMLAVFSFFAGLILDQTKRTRHEIKRLFYLSIRNSA